MSANAIIHALERRFSNNNYKIGLLMDRDIDTVALLVDSFSEILFSTDMRGVCVGVFGVRCTPYVSRDSSNIKKIIYPTFFLGHLPLITASSSSCSSST